ncbi:19958_t:CDS:10 [Rhizophagus irregularis]|uniref:Actin-like ATPase domain-containing protein n=1 Tax=Rhizophagus irregularis (strain DAOM 181602 / DAOM 197198 / MUCL 43194) TaxID=747089 RepID=U9UPS3_RHIID|nr:19958_t:CDS:10 [Rhizophagus irregularis]
MSEANDEIRVVVAIDFGTTYSGYAYAHKEQPDVIIVQDSWKEYESRFKTPTVVKYYDNYSDIKLWGYPALIEKPKLKKARLFSSSKLPKSSSAPIELFKLHLLKSIKGSEKPTLPRKLNYKNVIRDFMKKLGDDVKTCLKKTWQSLDPERNVLYILTVPAEFDDEAIATFRECVFNAGLLKDEESNNIRFITEPKAAAIHCLNLVVQNLTPGDSFMIVDCGGGTVDLTTCELLEDERLSELTECTGDCCGSSRIDEAFLEFVGEKVGKSAIESVRKNHYGQLQYFVQEFCSQVKLPFRNDEGMQHDIDLEESLPAIMNYVKGEERERLNDSEWIIEINSTDIKNMFDPVINKILSLIGEQLDKSEKKCSAIFLVGGFSESKYLQYRIRREFCKIPNISVPPHPTTSVVKGGVLYGLEEIIKDRTYGIETEIDPYMRRNDIPISPTLFISSDDTTASHFSCKDDSASLMRPALLSQNSKKSQDILLNKHKIILGDFI